MAKGSGMLRQTAPHPASGCRLVGASAWAAVLWGFAFFRSFDAKGRATKHRKLRCFEASVLWVLAFFWQSVL